MSRSKSANDWFSDPSLREVAAKIAGEIIMSENPGGEMRKWREKFSLTQVEVAAQMGVSASVLSDYESGRRKSPGAKFVARFVKSLILKDIERGGIILSGLRRILLGSDLLREAVIDMREFSIPISIARFCEAIEADLIVGSAFVSTPLLGYTLVDSIKLVLDVPSYDYVKLYGATTQRAAIFTRVSYGRSPMVAVKSMQAGMGGLRPALVVLHGVKKVDELGLEIAKRENIPLAVTRVEDLNELINKLRSIK
ncbi:helix-turn-helix domain-containing protein [Infirmifilum sp. NZ]|uniref:helix-turn-helix domain-containing protein n=1 Tax=Infirmifilum sp. NZ TaxID=2926850 RepID=UPI0027A41ED7|nr:helix-turn-helix domain-containing protein [Infirmifilum sp. NZ]UNQ72815.1 helix-turn-helix domain-containing protein [Infirmifilum sp. NZ]